MADCNRPKIPLLLWPLLAALALVSGCATASRSGIPTYMISGTAYVPLDAAVAGKRVRTDYDGLTRTVSLVRDSSSVKLQIGRPDVLLNGTLSKATSKVDLYKGMIVIPEELRQRLLEVFRETALSRDSFNCLRKIVIDAGHGGKDPGTTSRGGIEEKDVVLDIACRLRDALKKEGVGVVMTRSNDVYVRLPDRAEITNRSAADLFLSIHANSNPVRSLKGFEVYYISPQVSDIKRAVVSAKSGSFSLENSCLLSPSMNLKAILWDLTYAYDRRESVELSRMLCKAMRDSHDTNVIGVKNANFSVLRGAAIPAVLVEVGFLSNPSEESLIGSESYRQKLAENIKEGLRYYCEWLRETKTIAKGGR